MIDYIISNRAVHPTQIIDVRSLTSANIGSDHQLVIAKLRLTTQLKKKAQTFYVDKLNIESINDPIVKDLTQKIREQPILDQDDVEAS